jgi:hypothetical protein
MSTLQPEKAKLLESGPSKVINDDEISLKTMSDRGEEEKKELL